SRVAENLPLDRSLNETDTPYLTPQAHRGQRNDPAYVRYVAEELAARRGIRAEEAGRITAENGRSRFKL
ncbi:TatD family hydrolase, partial [Megasphaera massiliensis]